jgi:hypothetical protein
MGEIVTTALTCCVITLFGLALGFAFYKYNLIHFYWENQRITNKYQTSEKRMPLDSSLNLFWLEMEL